MRLMVSENLKGKINKKNEVSQGEGYGGHRWGP